MVGLILAGKGNFYWESKPWQRGVISSCGLCKSLCGFNMIPWVLVACSLERAFDESNSVARYTWPALLMYEEVYTCERRSLC